MSQDEKKTDDLFDRLAGKTPRNQTESDQNTDVLRNALQTQIDTMSSAEQASSDDLSAEEKAKMDVIKHQLLEQGLIGVASTSATNASSEEKTNWAQRLQKLIFGSGWERPVAVAMSILLVVVISIQIGVPPDLEPDFIVRGGATPEITTSNPVEFSDELATQLRAAGAQVLIVKVNTNDLTMRVDIPSAVKLLIIKKLFSDKGIKVEGYPPYRLKVKQSH